MLKCHFSTNFTLAEKAVTLHIYYTLQSWKREERSYHAQYHIPIIYMWVLGSNPNRITPYTYIPLIYAFPYRVIPITYYTYITHGKASTDSTHI